MPQNFNISLLSATQAFIKLGQYQEAISDCEWALKVSRTETKVTFDLSGVTGHMRRSSNVKNLSKVLSFCVEML